MTQSHPRLYFTADDLPRLRALRREGVHARIWENLRASADHSLTLTPRREWIAPVTPDPIYENLYDRFYAIMGDLAVTEHLAFAYAFSGDAQYGEAARQWVLASCRAWQREADTPPDGGKAYAVSRLLKGLAVGYDCLWPLWPEEERQEIRETLARIGQAYYDDYFTTPKIAGPGFHTHHAIVEWASFGVAALALLGEHDPAAVWLQATVEKFEEHLLPQGLAEDGAQVEGATFWASTMHYRLFFMDALRRVTGRDLYAPHAGRMNADLALAAIAAEKYPGVDEDHETVILEPAYGQLNYYAPVLLALAREYRRPLTQYLALWDHSLGALQDTPFTTPNGEMLRFELGGYAYVWYDSTLPAEASEAPRHYHFPSVDEAYLRDSWQPNDLVVGVRRGTVVVHAGGQVVLAELGDGETPMTVRRVIDEGDRAVIECAGDDGAASLRIELRRPGRLTIQRRAPGGWTWWSQQGARREGDAWVWEPGGRGAGGHGRRATLRLLTGSVTEWNPEGHRPEKRTGFNKLKLLDPAPRVYPRVSVAGDGEGVVSVEIRAE